MTLLEMLQGLRGQVELLETQGDAQVQITAITDDSRAVGPGSLFVAVKGERVDGHRYIPSAVAAGATGFVTQPPEPKTTITFAREAN